MPISPQLKRGDTFLLGCSSLNDDGTPQDVTDISIRSQVRTATTKRLVAELTVTKADQTIVPGEFELSYEDTKLWPLGVLLCDIEFNSNGTISSSDTIEFNLIGDITHDD